MDRSNSNRPNKGILSRYVTCPELYKTDRKKWEKLHTFVGNFDDPPSMPIYKEPLLIDFRKRNEKDSDLDWLVYNLEFDLDKISLFHTDIDEIRNWMPSLDNLGCDVIFYLCAHEIYGSWSPQFKDVKL